MLTACAAAIALAAAPTPGGAFPYPIHRTTLPNGLQVILVHQDAPGLAAYFTLFRVGSRNEVEPGRTGYAHFFEHLTFRGTRAHSAADWSARTRALGLSTNAFTDDDVTAYWAVGPAAALPELVALEADRFMNLDFDEDDFRVEARAVLGELRKTTTSPDFALDEAVRKLVFTRHTYGHNAMGFEADVRRMPEGYRYALELYRRFYRPDNAAVLVVGDFDEERVLAAVRAAYGPWKGSGESPRVEPEPPQAGPRSARVPWPAPILPRLWLGWRTPAGADVDATAAQLVLWPYLFGPASALQRDLVLDRLLVEQLAYEYQPHRDPFLFGVELVLKTPEAEAPARAAVEGAMAALAAGQVDAALLEDVKAYVRSSVVMQTDTPYATAVWLVYYTALTGDPGLLERVLRRTATLTPADLSAFARRWLTPQGRSEVVVATAPAAGAPGAAGGAR